MEDSIKKRVMKTDMDGFVFDETPVKTELAVINSIRDEYVSSFEVGLFGSNTDAKFEEFKTKLEKAGLQKVQDEMIKQLEEYKTKKNLN